jgi:hypothetical protein
MSGGHFNYAFTYVSNFASELQTELDEAGKRNMDGNINPDIHPEVKDLLQEIVNEANYYSNLMHETELYFSDDIGDDLFLDRVYELKAKHKPYSDE